MWTKLYWVNGPWRGKLALAVRPRGAVPAVTQSAREGGMRGYGSGGPNEGDCALSRQRAKSR